MLKIYEVDSFSQLRSTVLPYDNIVIYGAGKRGKDLLKSLQDLEIKVFGFAVTCKENNDVQGINVIEAGELSGLHNFIVMISVQSIADKNDIMDHLERCEVSKCIVGTDRFWMEVRKNNFDIVARSYRNKSLDNDKAFKIGYLSPGYSDANYPEERFIIDKLNVAPQIADKVKYIPIPKEVGGGRHGLWRVL